MIAEARGTAGLLAEEPRNPSNSRILEPLCDSRRFRLSLESPRAEMESDAGLSADAVESEGNVPDLPFVVVGFLDIQKPKKLRLFPSLSS